jgi:hypothetical protein
MEAYRIELKNIHEIQIISIIPHIVISIKDADPIHKNEYPKIGHKQTNNIL